ncbi:hypothetical protein ACIQNU_31660 [Streptomyces sp. NPDC091292]|uniref:hypothetical protein n=1 Tax=Streptomyces sp. NPDC091292 TaxID=3365991 RepID=UPI00382B3E1C
MSATSTRHSGRSRPTGHPLMLLGQRVVMGAVAVLLLISGVWASWGTAQHVMLAKGRERGTMTVERCGADECTGSYAPGTAGSQARVRVVLDQSVGARKGDRIAVTVKPGSDDVVRTGTTGLLRAWAPLGGGLLLAAVVVAGGLRMPRTAWVTAAAGGVLLAAAIATI